MSSLNVFPNVLKHLSFLNYFKIFIIMKIRGIIVETGVINACKL